MATGDQPHHRGRRCRTPHQAGKQPFQASRRAIPESASFDPLASNLLPPGRRNSRRPAGHRTVRLVHQSRRAGIDRAATNNIFYSTGTIALPPGNIRPRSSSPGSTPLSDRGPTTYLGSLITTTAGGEPPWWGGNSPQTDRDDRHYGVHRRSTRRRGPGNRHDARAGSDSPGRADRLRRCRDVNPISQEGAGAW